MARERTSTNISAKVPLLQQMSNQISEMQGRIDGMAAAIESLEGGLANLNSRVTAVETEFPEGTF